MSGLLCVDGFCGERFFVLLLACFPFSAVSLKIASGTAQAVLTSACVPEQEAQDIFGDADELLEEFRAQSRPGQQEPVDEEEDLDADDMGDDDEARADRLRAIVGLPALCAHCSELLPKLYGFPYQGAAADLLLKDALSSAHK